jgi:hypothetical protein
VFRFDRGRAELDRFRDEAVDPDVALRRIANLRISTGIGARSPEKLPILTPMRKAIAMRRSGFVRSE